MKNEFKGYKHKRYLDIIISLFVLFFLSPLILLTALAIKLFDGGPVIYQRRVIGFKGNLFLMFTFHSRFSKEIFQNNNGGRPINDPRVTRVGNFIRKFSLDELPQFFNVLRGDMSLVGYRPFTIWESKKPLSNYK